MYVVKSKKEEVRKGDEEWRDVLGEEEEEWKEEVEAEGKEEVEVEEEGEGKGE